MEHTYITSPLEDWVMKLYKQMGIIKPKDLKIEKSHVFLKCLLITKKVMLIK